MKTQKIKVQSKKFLSISTISLIVVNVFVIVQAVISDWDIGTLVWAYWLQTVIIAIVGAVVSKLKLVWIGLILYLIFYGIFICALTFPLESMTYIINDQQVTAAEFTKLSVVNWSGVFLSTIAFAINHIFSAIIDGKRAGSLRSAGIVSMRTVPIHFIIVLIAFVPLPVLFFSILKTIVDVAGHMGQHILIKKDQPSPEIIAARQKMIRVFIGGEKI